MVLLEAVCDILAMDIKFGGVYELDERTTSPRTNWAIKGSIFT